MAQHEAVRLRKPVMVRGVRYDSHRAAARALGVSTSAISKAIVRGTLETVGLHLNRNKPMGSDS